MQFAYLRNQSVTEHSLAPLSGRPGLLEARVQSSAMEDYAECIERGRVEVE